MGTLKKNKVLNLRKKYVIARFKLSKESDLTGEEYLKEDAKVEKIYEKWEREWKNLDGEEYEDLRFRGWSNIDEEFEKELEKEDFKSKSIIYKLKFYLQGTVAGIFIIGIFILCILFFIFVTLPYASWRFG